MEIKNFADYLIQILRCAILFEVPQNKPENLDGDGFFNFCQFHKLENIVYLMMKKYDKLGFCEEIYEKFKKSYMSSLSIYTRQEFYLEQIVSEFEKNGIDYLILKGNTLSSLYPSIDMRKSADFDIYVGADGAVRAKDIMLSIGFDIDSYYENIIEHDEYTANKSVHCELHKVLIQNKHPWQEECNKIVDNLRLCEGTKHCYEMTNEDFFVYNLAHTAKHMKFSGIGIRAFLDMWLIYKHLDGKMDMEYLAEKLRLCKLTEFEKHTKALCEYWFEGKETSDIIMEMADYVVKSGWVGTTEMAKSSEMTEYIGNSNLKSFAKFKKYYGFLFLSYDEMVLRYPWLEKHAWLTPFCAIHRVINAVLFRRNEIKQVNDDMNTVNMSDAKRIGDFKNRIGL